MFLMQAAAAYAHFLASRDDMMSSWAEKATRDSPTFLLEQSGSNKLGLRRARLRGPLYPHEPTCSDCPQSKYAASAPSLAASAGLALPRSREGKSRPARDAIQFRNFAYEPGDTHRPLRPCHFFSPIRQGTRGSFSASGTTPRS